MDCSDFVCAVLLGITYPNSRYVRGVSAKNIMTQHLGEMYTLSKPLSGYTNKSQGGLLSHQLAQYFAERGQLYQLPTDWKAAMELMEFGDIFFYHASSGDDLGVTYHKINHCAIVLGTAQTYKSGDIPVGNVIVAESSSGYENFGEGTACHIRPIPLNDILVNGKCSVIARPTYSKAMNVEDVLYLVQSGKMKIRDGLIPGMDILGTANETRYPGLKVGDLFLNVNWAATPHYIPVEPGSSVTFSGNATTSRGTPYCRCVEYDAELNQVYRGFILSDGTARTETMRANTKFVRFSFGWLAASGNKFWLSDTNDFEITITPPST